MKREVELIARDLDENTKRKKIQDENTGYE
jgi:hypothetical protein